MPRFLCCEPFLRLKWKTILPGALPMQKRAGPRYAPQPCLSGKIYIGYWVYRFLYRTISGSDPPQP